MEYITQKEYLKRHPKVSQNRLSYWIREFKIESKEMVWQDEKKVLVKEGSETGFISQKKYLKAYPEISKQRLSNWIRRGKITTSTTSLNGEEKVLVLPGSESIEQNN